MMQRVLFLVGALLVAVCCAINDRPVIGVLTQPTTGNFTKYGAKYIAASYVKYLESAGARVVPVQHDATQEDLNNYFNYLNGILFPGGDSNLDNTTLFQTGKFFYDSSLAAFDKDDVFPVMGHDTGMNLLVYCTSGNFDVLSPYDNANRSIKLTLHHTVKQSRLFGNAPDEILRILSEDGVAFFDSALYLSTDAYSDHHTNLGDFYLQLTSEKDRNGKTFVSTIEGAVYPIFGIQWHAEKPGFEWDSNEDLNHSVQSVVAMQYMANSFVAQARLSKHTFPTEEDENKALIYNYTPVYTFDDDPTYEQAYFF
jgi:hypothetical protein